MKITIIPLFLIFLAGNLFAQDIALPKPNASGGMPLIDAVARRKSVREFSPREIPLQMISDMLWVAVGINRSETGGRTYASASNRQDLDAYVALKSGFYRYDPAANILKLVVKEDLRSATGNQAFVTDSPMTLVYVGNFTKWAEGITENSVRCASVSTGAASQGVYLYCASAGLNAVVRGCGGAIYEKGSLDRKTQRVMLAHTIGFPKARD